MSDLLSSHLGAGIEAVRGDVKVERFRIACSQFECNDSVALSSNDIPNFLLALRMCPMQPTLDGPGNSSSNAGSVPVHQALRSAAHGECLERTPALRQVGIRLLGRRQGLNHVRF